MCLPPAGTRGAGSLNRPWVQYGVASWYGARERGRLMASGRPFDPYAMVAANLALPLGTDVEVTNLRNGRRVKVRIMDRGPYVPGRVLDLSEGAAGRLGFVHQGLAPVKVRVLNGPKPRVSAASGRSTRHADLPRLTQPRTATN